MHRITYLAAVAAVLMAGCAAKVIDSNERTVMVKAGTIDPASALRTAEAECKKFGRHAQLNTRPQDDPLWVFNCIE